MEVNPGLDTALRVPRGRWLAALACALVVGGCSAGSDGGGTAAASHHDAGVRLAPDPAYATARLAVVFDDPELQASNCRFRWRRNGVVIVGAESNGLDPSHVSRGDEISVAVFARDPSSGVVRTLNASVHVENTPPRLTRVSLLTDTASNAPVLKADVQCADQDGDTPTFAYRWFKNGVPVDGASAPSLPMDALTRGDRVAVEVVAHDEASSSVPMRSDPFAFTNHPPRFTSQPSAPRPADKVFQYAAVATDLDGDPLRYELVSGPDGMTVDPAGSVSWQLPAGDRRGSFPVRIRVNDSQGGEATQDFTISLDPAVAKK